MQSGHVYLFLLISFTSVNRLEALDLQDLGSFISEISSLMINSVHDVSCKYFECCNNDWVEADFKKLQYDLQDKVYGQQIVNEVVVSALRRHLRRHSPRSKALALSFHGRPGVGKNYVASFIQNSLFHKGFKSKYSHYFTGRVHFPLQSQVDLYKLNLMDWIRGNVSLCQYSLFVFDEVDKMPQKLLDAVKPFIDYHKQIDGIDFRKSVFIFLSNTGGDAIAEELLKLMKTGKRRDDLRLKDFEDIIKEGAFNEKGGFYKSEAIESSLIDHYIPFLPLEESHVRLCILEEFRKRGIFFPSKEKINEVLEDFSFVSESKPIFSNGGCKRIAQKVVTVMERTRHWEL